MLTRNDPDSAVLKRVVARKKPTANDSHRAGWPWIQFRSLAGQVGGHSQVFLRFEGRLKENRLCIPHSMSQSAAISPVRVRRRAILGTSK